MSLSPLTLHVDSFVGSEVSGISTTGNWHLVVRTLLLLRGSSSLVRHAVGEELVFSLAVENLVVFVFPLLARVFSSYSRVF